MYSYIRVLTICLQLADILPIMTALLPRTPSLALLAPAITALHLAQLLEVLLCGFELELYARDEWIRVWWVGERLAGRLEDTWAQLRAPERVYVEARWNEVRVVRAMCAASISVRFDSPPVLVSRPSSRFRAGILREAPVACEDALPTPHLRRARCHRSCEVREKIYLAARLVRRAEPARDAGAVARVCRCLPGVGAPPRTFSPRATFRYEH